MCARDVINVIEKEARDEKLEEQKKRNWRRLDDKDENGGDEEEIFVQRGWV